MIVAHQHEGRRLLSSLGMSGKISHSEEEWIVLATGAHIPVSSVLYVGPLAATPRLVPTKNQFGRPPSVDDPVTLLANAAYVENKENFAAISFERSHEMNGEACQKERTYNGVKRSKL